MGKQKKKFKSMKSGCVKPDFKTIQRDSSTFDYDFQNAMHYVQYDIKQSSLKTTAVKYAKKQNLDHKSLDLVAGYKFGTLGKVCYVVVHGGEVPEQWATFIDTEITKLIEEGKAISSDTTEEETLQLKHIPNIQETLRDQAASMAEDFDDWIDGFASDPKKFSMKDRDPLIVLRSKGAKAAHARHIIKFYECDLEELRIVLKKEDSQLMEGYSAFSVPQLKRFISLFETIISAANMVIDSAKASKAPRKRKKIDIEKIVSKLKFQKDDPALRVVSINPAEIVGAKELWVYNVKTRKLGRYIAEDNSELSVRGTTIQNFDPKSTEKTLRKPKEQLTAFRKAGKVALRKFMDNLTTVDIKLKGRISEHHVLLKAA